jgi:hypothetical protein
MDQLYLFVYEWSVDGGYFLFIVSLITGDVIAEQHHHLSNRFFIVFYQFSQAFLGINCICTCNVPGTEANVERYWKNVVRKHLCCFKKLTLDFVSQL